MKAAFWPAALLFLALSPVRAANQSSDNWIDISSANLAKLGSQGGIGGCAGCAVDRLNGDVMVNFIKGATWQLAGSEIDLAQGPCFGADERTMVATGPKGVFKTIDSGKTWMQVAALRGRVDGKEPFDVGWFGDYAWDPINNVVYATRMTCPAIKIELGSPAKSKPVRKR